MAVNVYKSISLENLRNRTVSAVSANDKAKANQTMVNFIAYLKAAHS